MANENQKKKGMVLGQGAAALFGNVDSSRNEKPNINIINRALGKMDISFEKDESDFSNDGVSLVDIKNIFPNPNQPRKIFKEVELEELSSSIRENGVIQPLIVSKREDGGFDLIAGERRLKASIKAGLEKVPVVIKHATDKDKMLMALIENIQRSDLNCIEEALGYFQLMDDYKLTQEEVAKKVGKNRATVANHLRILKLPRPVIEFIQKDFLSFGHAKILAALEEREDIIRIANMTVTENLSVRDMETLVKKNKSKKPFSKPNQITIFDEQLDNLKEQLEKKTGFHFMLKGKKSGKGKVIINFNNEAELNDIFEYLIKVRS